jgi:hypothetical protein
MRIEMLSELEQIVRHRRFSADELLRKSDRVFRQVLRGGQAIAAPNFDSVSAGDLRIIFEEIDESFFDGAIIRALTALKYPLRYRISRRMTSSGGTTTMRSTSRMRREFEIAVSSTLLFQSFRDRHPISVTGLVCNNRLEALLRIMEHETVHLIELILWQDSSCGAARFHGIANRFFGHRRSTHQLLSPAENAVREFGLAPGDRVEFVIDGQRLEGFVNRITRRATILVPDDNGTPYDDGVSYRKYYVPIRHLKLMKSRQLRKCR